MTSYVYLEPYLAKIHNDELRTACEAIAFDAAYKDFVTWPASLGFHHAYENGLLVHTMEVLDLALHAADNPAIEPDLDILIAAALWHDVAKIWEYKKREARYSPGLGETGWVALASQSGSGFVNWVGSIDYYTKTDYARTIGHISGSNAEFVHRAIKAGVDRTTINKVSHCLLSHHGPVREWGSPVPPESLEAVLLHQADILSAKFGATKDRRPEL